MIVQASPRGDVIKIESPDGGNTRLWGPPFVQDAHGVDADADAWKPS